jgi:hypothetical protein
LATPATVYHRRATAHQNGIVRGWDELIHQVSGQLLTL